MSDVQYVYEIREIAWESWEVTENGKRLAVMSNKRAAENWRDAWISNGRRDYYYNMVGE